ncbi:hypothetical protein NE237_022824 [Protea cynaroides]|uniref:Uncharacterized protein n=1 Tax=Protea cynaroides TaxID=273540 RepID=A0A9Q0K5M3_9MAGN|nr:hypothetical protein NE237_022824 [Protea cynaroides]
MPPSFSIQQNHNSPRLSLSFPTSLLLQPAAISTFSRFLPTAAASLLVSSTRSHSLSIFFSLSASQLSIETYFFSLTPSQLSAETPLSLTSFPLSIFLFSLLADSLTTLQIFSPSSFPSLSPFPK